MTWECQAALEAAWHGRVDLLVVDGSRSTYAELTALNFLRQERPALRIYLYLDGEDGAAARLERWESALSLPPPAAPAATVPARR